MLVQCFTFIFISWRSHNVCSFKSRTLWRKFIILVKLMSKLSFVLISTSFRVCQCSCCKAVCLQRQKCYFWARGWNLCDALLQDRTFFWLRFVFFWNKEDNVSGKVVQIHELEGSTNDRGLVPVERRALLGVGTLPATWAFSGPGLG